MSNFWGSVCRNCLFWRPTKEYEVDKPYRGTCRRYPPVYTTARELDFQPKTAAMDWCGEFTSKEKKEEDGHYTASS